MNGISASDANGVAIEKARRRIAEAQMRIEVSDDLIRRCDCELFLKQIGIGCAHNLLESWLMGNRNGTVSTLTHILDLAIEMAQADFGNIQLFDPAECGLRIAASRGLSGEFLEYFAVVRSSDSACALAMQQNSRVIVSDVGNDPCFNSESRQVVLRAGALAVQSTPIISSSGRRLGMLSTHRRVRGKPPLASLLLLDRLARRTATVLE